MELIAILNRCHRFRGFIYHHAHFSADKKSIEVAVRPRKGSTAVCSRCHLPAPGYDQLAERRFEFIPPVGVSRLFSVRHATRRLSPLRRCGCRRSSLGQRQMHTDQSLHALPSPLGEATVMERDGGGLSRLLGQGLRRGRTCRWEYSSPAWAGKFLDEWRRQTMRSRIEPMKKIARSLRNRRELILNYFRAQKMLSSGVVEGLNNKAKVTMRKSYGFRTCRVLELALYHSLGKLPEPESTRDFF
jgi:hypothetical protein